MARRFNINFDTYYLLSSCFSIGMNIRQACEYIGIKERTFYYWCKHIEGFREDIFSLREELELKMIKYTLDDIEDVWLDKYFGI